MIRKFFFAVSIIFCISYFTSLDISAQQKDQNLIVANHQYEEYKLYNDRRSLLTAIEYYKKAAALDNAEACYVLSKIYSLSQYNMPYAKDIEWVERGEWIENPYSQWPTHKIAENYLKKACTLGHKEASFSLAYDYSSTHEYEKALELLYRLSDKDPEVLFRIGMVYLDKGDYQDAKTWFGKASQADPNKYLPELSFWSKYMGDINLAIKSLEEWIRLDKYKSVKKSSKIEAQNKRLNYNYLLTYYIEINDWESALQMAKRLNLDIKTLTTHDIISYNPSKKSELTALRSLLDDFTNYFQAKYILDDIAIQHGDPTYLKDASKFLYDNGEYNKAYKYLTSDLDNTDKHLLGLCQYYGDGTDIDYNEAFKNFTSCKDPDSHYHIGLCYYNGQGVPEQDYDLAFEYFMKAAEWSSIGGMEMLARCYRFGRGCEIDEEKADYWLEEAAKASEKAKEAARVLREP